ncbi:MAG: choice-of-anchor tandem repeat GloVer-containing protein [Terriglobales bacterium]
MTNESLTLALLSALVLMAILILMTAPPAAAQTETLLYAFTGGTDGGQPFAHLASDGAGNFYGTTAVGGLGYGTVFEVSPNGNGGWNETVLHAFTDGADGGYPLASPVIFDSHGNIYGTTAKGGANGFGVFFELSPAGKSWNETVLYNFASGVGGVYPFNGLIMDSAGNFYGTDNVYQSGHAITEGVFELSQSGGSWTEKVIYDNEVAVANFGGGGLTMDSAGNIFGISSGGFLPQIVFELSPNGHGVWKSTVLHSFAKRYYAEGAPVLDKSGNLYGTTASGGASNNGTVYKLSPGKNGKWTEDVVYAFKGGTQDGSAPNAGIVFDAAGNIYGTTAGGGPSNDGTVFELVAPGGKGNHQYREKVLWSFNGADGSQPFGSLILDSAGNIYGVAPFGDNRGCTNDTGCGVVFEVTP